MHDIESFLQCKLIVRRIWHRFTNLLQQELISAYSLNWLGYLNS
jgi:hypothetical protein